VFDTLEVTTLKATALTAIATTRLARICAYSSQAPEWEQFVVAVMPVVLLSVRRVSQMWGETSSSTISEIVQEVFVKLCEDDRRILRNFEDRGDNSLIKLMRVVAASVATDHFRRTRAEKRGGRMNNSTAQPSLHMEELHDAKATEAVEWPTLLSQLDGLLKLNSEAISSRDRNLFWLYYRQGMTADAISRIPAIGLSAKGVESALARIVRLLREMIVNGKPGIQSPTELPAITPSQPVEPQKNTSYVPERKGFSSVVAIDTMKRR
jgi:RNA polymerase sigma-70 factor (ECF subfamily)